MIGKHQNLDSFRQSYSHLLAAMVQDLPIENGDKIVELGSGLGFLTFPLCVEFPKSEVISVDLSHSALNQLKVKAKQGNLSNLKLYQSDAANLGKVPNSSVDVVISNFFLSEIVSRNKLKVVFNETLRILRSSGVTVHSELLRKHKTRDQHLLVLADRYYAEEDVRWWEPEMIELFLEQSGFVSVVRKDFKWGIGVKGKGVDQMLGRWEISPEFQEQYGEELERHGLAFPKGYILTAKPG